VVRSILRRPRGHPSDLNCSCRPAVSDSTIYAAVAINHTNSEVPDACRCVTAGKASLAPWYSWGRAATLEVHATCVSAAGPICGANPPLNYGEECQGACELGTVECDGTCNAPPEPVDQGDSCTAWCQCSNILGTYYRDTEGTMNCGVCYADSCAGVCD
jgi:hypothetical protein